VSLSVGDPAPPFSLASSEGGEVSLSGLLGQPLVIVFYPGDDTPVCTKQLNSYNDDLAQFQALNARVVAISAQSVESHKRFAGKHGFKFPLLADTDKSVAAAYGTLGPLGFPRRSVFVIDSSGVVRYAHRAIAGLTFRPVGELIDVLLSLSH
jgi:peroxiredoxin Q/BCP